MANRHKTIIAGASGVVGRNLIEHLHKRGDWEVLGVSRCPPETSVPCTHLPVDLTDRGDCMDKLAGLDDITHVFYAGRAPRPDPFEEANINRDMLANLVEGVEAANPHLEHVHLVHGTKWYGCQMGPFPTPSREDDPRQLQPTFYYTQHDYITERQRGKSWHWSSVRPPLVCGFSMGNPHNLLTTIGVYATVSKELGLPLRFPGNEGCFSSLYQAVDADLLADAITWAATEPGCANQAFNITNGDCYRWSNLWPKLADFFAMEAGGVQEVKLTDRMPAYRPVWDRAVQRYGLRPNGMDSLASWQFADLIFSLWWDDMSSTIKSRRFGFHAAMDTETMFIERLQALRDAKIIP